MERKNIMLLGLTAALTIALSGSAAASGGHYRSGSWDYAIYDYWDHMVSDRHYEDSYNHYYPDRHRYNHREYGPKDRYYIDRYYSHRPDYDGHRFYLDRGYSKPEHDIYYGSRQYKFDRMAELERRREKYIY